MGLDDDFKVGVFNSISLMISFTDVENFLKVVLLIASITYTIQRIYVGCFKNNNNDKEL
jgi:hypothetical protein